MRAENIPLAYYRYLYKQVGARWHWVDRLRLSDKRLAALLHSAASYIGILYVNGAPAGFYELRHESEEVVELCHFGLMEHALGSASANGSSCRRSAPPGTSTRRS